MKNIFIKILVLIIMLTAVSCQDLFEEFPDNPNVAGENDPVPPAFILRQLLVNVARGADAAENEPLAGILSRLNQYTTGLTFPLYGGSNQYNWTDTGNSYPWLRNIIRLEKSAESAIGTERNGYLAISKFLRAYTFIWLTQRVGDIPMMEAGQGLEALMPKFDTQEEIYAAALILLEEANQELAAINADATSIPIDGDIFYNNDLRKWRKAVNAYKLRVLISLSKRAEDTPSLSIKQRFQQVLSDSEQYPIFEDIDDNLNFFFVPVFNRYPSQFILLYPNETTISETVLELMTKNKDPRTFIVATPAPYAINIEGRAIDDFNAYNGADNSRAQNDLFAESQGNGGKYSYINYIRYLQGPDDIPEPNILIGYSEMCFNIAEAINRGWVTGNAEEWYLKGVTSSLEFYGLSQGSTVSVGDVNGVPYGDVSIDVDGFIENISYKGNNQDGLTQILEQKYVAFWQNSGWEPFYNFRRTGVPQFREGEGTNAQRRIPRRWQYPVREVDNNRENTIQAIERQFGGTDDLFADMWLIK
jgi:hypothetical protein